MSDNTLTSWFASGVQPARVGVYETRWAPGQAPWQARFPQYQYWDGYTWGGWGMSTEIAANNARSTSVRQAPEWRGLAAPAAAIRKLGAQE
jgi:hypothetical protein